MNEEVNFVGKKKKGFKNWEVHEEEVDSGGTRVN